MSTDFNIEFQGEYIQVKLASDYEITPKGTDKLWTTISDSCSKYTCKKILGEGSPVAVHIHSVDIVKSAIKTAEALKDASVAIYEPKYFSNKLRTLFQNITWRKGLQLGVFSDCNEALRFLEIHTHEQIK